MAFGDKVVWSFGLVDSAGNPTTPSGLSLLSNVAVTFQLGSPDVLTGTLPVTSAEAAAISSGDMYVKAYRKGPFDTTKVLRFYGPVWIDEIQAGRGGGVDAVMVTAMTPLVYLTKRFTTATFTNTDQGTILKTVIDTTNSVDGETGIRTSAANITASADINVDHSTNKTQIMQLLQQFLSQDIGCESYTIPIELSSGKIADFYATPRKGIVRERLVFGYGDGTVANCSAMGRVRSMDNVFNDVLGFTDSFASNWTNPTSIANNRRLVSDMSFTSETDPDVLSQQVLGFLDRHVDATAAALYTISATNRAPKLFDDFDIGDTVTLEFKKGLEFQVQQRVYSSSIGITDNGIEYFNSLELKSL